MENGIEEFLLPDKDNSNGQSEEEMNLSSTVRLRICCVKSSVHECWRILLATIACELDLKHMLEHSW